jgi:hypothetical protein
MAFEIVHYTCPGLATTNFAGSPEFYPTTRRGDQEFGNDTTDLPFEEQDHTIVWECELCGATVGVEGDVIYI